VDTASNMFGYYLDRIWVLFRSIPYDKATPRTANISNDSRKFNVGLSPKETK
jgi:hypothetical protein